MYSIDKLQIQSLAPTFKCLKKVGSENPGHSIRQQIRWSNDLFHLKAGLKKSFWIIPRIYPVQHFASRCQDKFKNMTYVQINSFSYNRANSIQNVIMEEFPSIISCTFPLSLSFCIFQSPGRLTKTFSDWAVKYV